MAGRSTSSRLDAHGPKRKKAPTSARRSGPSSSCRSGGDLVVVGDDLGGLDLGGLGRGERGGPEVGMPLVRRWPEQPGQGQPLVEESASPCGGGNQPATRWVVCVGADGPSLRPHPTCVLAALAGVRIIIKVQDA